MLAFRHVARVGCLITLSVPGMLAADIVPRSQDRLEERARDLLHNGQPVEAARLINPRLTAADAGLWSLAGEIQLRIGDFAAAAHYFHAALDRNPSVARAWWGLGRIEQIHFRQTAARDFFAKAYRQDWRDPDIASSYLEFVSEPAARRRLLNNVVNLTRNISPARAAQAQARIAIEDRLGDKEPAALASDYIPYRIPLREFHPLGANPRGLIVSLQVNGKRPLRFLLDTGARGPLLGESAARDLGLEPVVASEVFGFGDREGSSSVLTLASSLSIGALVFRDCLVEVVSSPLPPGVDGILGAGLFERFRIRIDAGARTLELSPQEFTGPRMPAIGLDRLLLVRAGTGGHREGWFLLDTGAAFTAVSPSLHAAPRSVPDLIQLVGLQGNATAFRSSPLPLRVGGHVLPDTEPVVCDLTAISRREGVEISGVLGFSTLRRWPVTIDFRSGSVRIGD